METEKQEVEVTPQMIDAGLQVYFEHDFDADDPSRFLCAVFRAMSASCSQSALQAPGRS